MAMKETKGIKRKETNMTADSARKANAARLTKKAAPKPAAKPAARSKAGASTVAAVAKRFGVTAREARDIAKAIGNVAESAVAAKNIKNPGQQYLGGQALKASVKDLKKQVKETGRAAKSGTKGTRAGNLSYNIDTGSPQGLKGKERPKYRGSLTQY